MQDFRARREVEAKKSGTTPGLRWHYKVDGKLQRTNHLRTSTPAQSGRQTEVREVIIGDMGFADDTTLVGEEEGRWEGRGEVRFRST